MNNTENTTKTIELNVQHQPEFFTKHKGFGYSVVDYGNKTIRLYNDYPKNEMVEVEMMMNSYQTDLILKEGRKGQLSQIRKSGGQEGFNLVITYDYELDNQIVDFKTIK